MQMQAYDLINIMFDSEPEGLYEEFMGLQSGKDVSGIGTVLCSELWIGGRKLNLKIELFWLTSCVTLSKSQYH